MKMFTYLDRWALHFVFVCHRSKVSLCGYWNSWRCSLIWTGEVFILLLFVTGVRSLFGDKRTAEGVHSPGQVSSSSCYLSQESGLSLGIREQLKVSTHLDRWGLPFLVVCRRSQVFHYGWGNSWRRLLTWTDGAWLLFCVTSQRPPQRWPATAPSLRCSCPSCPVWSVFTWFKPHL